MTGPDYSKAIYLLILGGIAACIGFFSIRSLLDLARLQSGETCTGKIIAKRIDTDDGRFYYAAFGFRDGAGRTHEREIQLRKSAYDSLQEGQTINIVYQASNPSNSYLAGAHFRQSYFLGLCGLLLFAAILCFVGYSFINYCVLSDACGS
jgi:hypothetical protein